jgi:hypothetical protein
MTPAPSDLGQNISTTIYLLFSHNYIAMAYFLGLIIGIILAIYRPSRFATFIFLGFAILLFSYEYDKHIIDAFREQTIKSFITAQPHFRLQRIIDVVIAEILPILFYIAGWAFLFVAIIVEGIKVGKRKKQKNY